MKKTGYSPVQRNEWAPPGIGPHAWGELTEYPHLHSVLYRWSQALSHSFNPWISFIKHLKLYILAPWIFAVVLFYFMIRVEKRLSCKDSVRPVVLILDWSWENELVKVIRPFRKNNNGTTVNIGKFSSLFFLVNCVSNK